MAEQGKLKFDFTTGLIETLRHPGMVQVLLPPHYQEKITIAHFDEEYLERIDMMITHGVNMEDDRIMEALVKREDDHLHAFGWHEDYVKRFMSVQSFRGLEKLGIHVQERDFKLIDMDDSRTSLQQHLMDEIPVEEGSGIDKWDPSLDFDI
mmetsp:Transcript_11479/g.16833  ORF Transcript_11479/g.16833 Transcript_11479/m.16833 type:complete len:151 (-) Transcript_11479:120-572(-)